MHYYFKEDIELEYIQELVNKLEGQENIKLYFETFGGTVNVMEFLIDFLNSLGNKIEVVLTGFVYSAGTKILTDYTGKLTISPEIDMMLFHKWDRQIYTLRKDSDNKYLTKQSEKRNKDFAKKLKQKRILNKEQLKRFKKGEDIRLYTKDILKLKLNNG